MNKSAAIKTFAMTNMLIEADLDKIEQKYQIDHREDTVNLRKTKPPIFLNLTQN